MCLSDLEIAHGFEHSNDMGTESWRIGVVTRIETGGMTRMNVRPDYPSHGVGAPVVAAVFTVLLLGVACAGLIVWALTAVTSWGM